MDEAQIALFYRGEHSIPCSSRIFKNTDDVGKVDAFPFLIYERGSDMNTTTNYGFGKPEADELYDIEVMNSNMDAIDSKMKENEEHSSSVEKNISDHAANTDNPHGVTKSQVGLSKLNNAPFLAGHSRIALLSSV